MNDKLLNGFKVLPLKYTNSSLTEHKIYIKEHSVRDHTIDKPPGRTLFVLNIPPFADEKSIHNIFKEAGKIESVVLQDKPSSSDKKSLDQESPFTTTDSTGYKVAYIVFNKKSELNNALKLNLLPPICSDTYIPLNGAIKWIKEYNARIPNVTKVKADIESFMKKYDIENKKKVLDEKALGEEDEDGWTTVTRHSRKPGFERKETVGNKIKAQEKVRQQKKELKNFYTFQIRESKMKHIVALRQKFEEDKKKIALLRESRRFKPF